VLRQSDQPVTPRDLRQACHVRTRTLYQALAELVEAGTILRDAAGYRPAPAPASSAATATAPLQSNTGNGSGNTSVQPKDIL
jgi:DNA-binding IclR family transcriptional regulator